MWWEPELNTGLLHYSTVPYPRAPFLFYCLKKGLKHSFEESPQTTGNNKKRKKRSLWNRPPRWTEGDGPKCRSFLCDTGDLAAEVELYLIPDSENNQNHEVFHGTNGNHVTRHNGKSVAAFSSLSPDTSFWFNHNNLSGKWINVKFFSINLCTSENKNQNKCFSQHNVHMFGSLKTFSFSYFLLLLLGLVVSFIIKNKIF